MGFMIEIKDLEKKFDGVSVLSNVNLNIEEGSIYGLVGSSGAGKSTLLRCINGLTQYTSGSLKIENHEIKDLKDKHLRELKKNIGMIFQQFSLLERKTVLENIALPMKCWGYKSNEIKRRSEELLDLVGLHGKGNVRPKELSGGQKQRVAIARALSMNPKILLCDEATSALDPNTAKSILDLLKKINRDLSITIIIVAHQMNVVKQVCDRVAILEQGKIMIEGNTEKIFFEKPEILKTLLGDNSIDHLPQNGMNLRINIQTDSDKFLLNNFSRDIDVRFKLLSSETQKFKNKEAIFLELNIESQDVNRVTDYLNENKVEWEVI